MNCITIHTSTSTICSCCPITQIWNLNLNLKQIMCVRWNVHHSKQVCWAVLVLCPTQTEGGVLSLLPFPAYMPTAWHLSAYWSRDQPSTNERPSHRWLVMLKNIYCSELFVLNLHSEYKSPCPFDDISCYLCNLLSIHFALFVHLIQTSNKNVWFYTFTLSMFFPMTLCTY